MTQLTQGECNKMIYDACKKTLKKEKQLVRKRLNYWLISRGAYLLEKKWQNELVEYVLKGNEDIMRKGSNNEKA